MVTVWGLLAKSLTDSETIEEMVDRKIAEHEQDPESHMGEGESIDVHRKTEIVDHLAGSVLNDKFTMNEFSFVSNFRDLTNFSTYGEASVDQHALGLYIEEGAVPKSYAHLYFFRPSPFLTTQKDFLLQFLAQTDMSNTNGKIYMGHAFGNNPANFTFFGFERINGVLKGIAQKSTTKLSTGTITVDMSQAHIYRVQFVQGENKLYYYIDGQKVGEITYTLADPTSDGGPLFYSELTSSNDGYLYIADLFVSRKT